MLSLEGEAAVVTTHSTKLYTGGSRGLSFSLKTATSNSTTKEFSELRFLSSVLITVEFGIGDKGTGIEIKTEKE